MKNLNIDRAKNEDLNNIINLSYRCLMNESKNGEIILGIANPINNKDLFNLFVCRLENKIVAACVIYKIDDKEKIKWFEIKNDKPCIEIGKICVDSDYRGSGIASEMIKYVKNHFKNYNIYADILYSPVRNIPSEKLFEKNGFVKYNIKDWKNERLNIDAKWTLYKIEAPE